MSVRSEQEIQAAAFKLRTEKRMTMRQIADELDIPLGKVGDLLKGVPKGGVEEQEPQKKVSVPSQMMPMLITKEYVAKLYAMAMDEGFDDVNAWIKDRLLPWYAVKRDLEWKLRLKIEPKTFTLAFETTMLDSIELKELKNKLGSMSGQPATTQPVNKPEVESP